MATATEMRLIGAVATSQGVKFSLLDDGQRVEIVLQASDYRQSEIVADEVERLLELARQQTPEDEF